MVVVRGGASAERSITPLMKPALLVSAALIFGGSVGHAQASGDSARAQPNDSLARAKTDTTVGGPRIVQPHSRGHSSRLKRRPYRPVRLLPWTRFSPRPAVKLPPGRPAPGLLTVVFRAGTPDTARMAAAREVSGTLAGMTASGEDYVRLSPESGPLVVAAARLIRLPPVTSVSEKSCP